MDTSVFLQILIFAISVFVLVKGSDLFVAKAEKVGLSLGISPFIIGVTVVAIGTSLPELASSIAAVAEGKSAIVIGNVVGSNISNILLVLGLVAVIARIVNLGYSVMDSDIPYLLASSVFLLFTVKDGQFTMVEAVLFLISICGFFYNSIKNGSIVKSENVKIRPLDIAILVGSGAMIYLGSEYTVRSMSSIAQSFQVSEGLIAITILALGTSLPEVSVSLTAAKKGNSQMAVGNVLGSNIFNTFGVMSIASFFGSLEIPQSVQSFGLPFMVATTFLFAFCGVSGRINKWVGFLFLILYGYFTYEIIISELGSIS